MHLLMIPISDPQLKGLNAWGIQIGSFAADRAIFALKFFKLFLIHTGETNS